jgi:hypothetical protein
MKPNFALNLTEDRIGLLQRTGRGWRPLGEAVFGAPDMEDQLTALREKAAHATPRGISTKLVIPNSQILYTTIKVSAATDSGKRDEIRAALAGRTPYAVEDLAFDWCGDGPEVKVAVVARETLDEAESFAVDRAFRPMSFVAIPDPEAFDGEPMFGATAFSAAALGKGRRLERDLVPIRIIGADAAAAMADDPVQADDDTEDDTADMAAEAPDTAEPPAAMAAEAPALTTAAIFPEAETPDGPWPDAQRTATDTDDPLDAIAAQTGSADTPEARVTVPAAPAPQADPAVPVDTAPAGPRFTIAAVTDPATSVVSPQVPDVADEAPFADVSDQAADPAGADDDLPPAPSTAALMAFASRRAALDGPAKPLGAPPPRAAAGGTAMPGLLADRLAARAQMPGPDGAAAAPLGPSVTAPSLPGGKRRKPLAGGAAAPAMPMPDTPRKPLTKPGGTFGSAAPVRGKPRFLGLILTGILILFLALVAAWSSFFLASNGTDDGSTTDVATDVAVAEPDVPLVDDEMLADGQLPEDVALAVPAPDDPPPDDPVVATGPAPDAATPPADPIAAPDTAGPAPETGVDASDGAVAGPAAVASDAGGDEIFLSRADAPLAPGAAADLAAPAPVGDTAPAAQLPPPPFGTVYTFNPDGTIAATPEGILTPEGVRLVAGPPQAVPPARPPAVAAAAEAPSVPATLPETLPPVDETTAVGADPALADARPRSRPANLVPPDSDDDAALQGDQPIPASVTRPRSRPETVLAAGEAARLESEAASLAAASAAAGSAAEAAILGLAAEPAATTVTPSGSRLALSVSRIPAPRPRDLERAVAAALAAATRAPDPEPEPEPSQAAAASTAAEADEEPELASAAPSAPISGSVADQATFVNAINLSRVNLIGIYGSQSDRRALIRQGNGRYKTVTVGDRVDGGTIAAITATEVRYQKGGRLIALQMPDT